MSTEAGSHGRRLCRRLGAALDRIGSGPVERPIQHLEGLRTVQEMLKLAEAALVEAALKSGHSYGEVGKALGVSRQAARQAHLARQQPADPFNRWLRTRQAEENQRKTRKAA